jgi:hypothetical protein
LARKGSSTTAATGCGCVVLGILACALFIGGIFTYTSVVAQQTWFPPGEPAHFDPIATFGAIQSHAGSGTRLLSFEARFVRADGTLDLTATVSPSPSVEYRFARALSSPPQDAPPLGTGRRADDHWYEPITVVVSRPWQLRSVSRASAGVRTTYQYFNLGMAREAGRPQAGPEATFAPRPACPLRDLWKLAADRGAPTDAVAVVRYGPAGYSFRIEGTPVDLAFGVDCAPLPPRP